MKLLLISNSTNFGENYLAWASTQIELFCLQNHINKESRIIFIPFAGVNIGGMAYPQSYDAYESKVRNVFRTKFGLENFTSVHHFDDKVKAVNEADCIVVGGGNTFHLVAEMHRYRLMEAIRNRALPHALHHQRHAYCGAGIVQVPQPRSFPNQSALS